MFSWLKRKHHQPARPVDNTTLAWATTDIPRYPPFMKGLPVVSPKQLVDSQSELVAQIANMAISNANEFDRFFLPSIERFAAFVHLLPASQSHHHRGAGGLLRHSLEVGLWALQSADKVLLDAAKSPSQRRKMEPRWQLAVFAAALCHDAGKPATDVVITNKDRSSTWRPIKESLYEWALSSDVDAYFLDWRDGRARQHTALSNLIADRIIGTEALDWIGEGGTELVIWMLESLNCNPGPLNRIHDLVVKADQASVERDLKSLGAAMAGYDLGVPVERHLTDVMRRLVREGVWRINEPGARLWNIAGHTYLVWPAAGDEIVRQIREDGVPGIPRTPDGILDMLVERQIAFVRSEAEPGDRLWKIAPACLVEKIPDITLTAIRLRDDSLVSTAPIMPVAGRVIGVADSAEPADVHVQRAPEEQPVGDLTTQLPAQSSHVVPPPSPEPASQKSGNDAGGLDRARDTTEPSQPRRGSHANLATVAPAIQHVVPVVLDGPTGEALKALAHDLRTGDKLMGRDAAVDKDGQLILRWPGAFSSYGLTTKAILDELSARDWLWVDPMAPLKRVLDGEMEGVPAKTVRLEKNASIALLALMGDPDPSEMQACNPHSDSGLPSAPAPTTDARTPPPQPPAQPEHAASGKDRGPPKPRKRAQAAPARPAASVTAPVVSTSDQSKPAPPRKPLALAELLNVLDAIDAQPQPDGWRSITKRQAIDACAKRGIGLSHGHLARLCAQDPSRLTVSGGDLLYCSQPTQAQAR